MGARLGILRAGAPSASDVYQLGLVFYELLTGRGPWSFKNGEHPTPEQVRELQDRHAPIPLVKYGVRSDVAALGFSRCEFACGVSLNKSTPPSARISSR